MIPAINHAQPKTDRIKQQLFAGFKLYYSSLLERS